MPYSVPKTTFELVAMAGRPRIACLGNLSTTGMRFVDTNIFVYSVSPDPSEQDKKARARALLTATDLIVSSQVLQELYRQLVQPPPRGTNLPHQQAIDIIKAVRGRVQVVPITEDIVTDGLNLYRRFQLQYWDAFILAAAKASGCNTVCSEDFSHTQDYCGISVVNPFAHNPLQAKSAVGGPTRST